MNYKSDFLSKNIITYLGNKRKLLEFINDQVDLIVKNDKELSSKNKEDIICFDIFSGSGIVSRCLKQAGYTVYSNDLEVYSQAINFAFIETNLEDLPLIFKDIPTKLKSFYDSINISYIYDDKKNEYEQTIDLLNSVRSLGKKQKKPYFSKFYAPKDTNNTDFEKERLFFTQENGQFLDAVLDVIFDTAIFSQKANYIVLADLFSKMTKNINTSGTMKGFHNGWGGKSKNALNRILADMELDYIPLLKNKAKGKYFQDYAEKVFQNNDDLKVDIIYADPPYNQHQYSANYHMLTTAFNDRDYDVGEIKKGTRAGIRVDHNRSDFSKSRKEKVEGYDEKVSMAYVAFNEFIFNAMDFSKYIIVSYNQEGVLSHEQIIDILSQNGKNSVSIETKKHEKYKGGKNTNISNSVVEYLFVVKTNAPQSEVDQNDLKKQVVLDIYEKLIDGKYIDIDKFKEKDSYNSTIQKTDTGYNVCFDNNSKNMCLILNNEFKVISNTIDELSLELIQFLESKEYEDFDKKRLIDKYIVMEMYLPAIKMLSSFKIKKHQSELLDYISVLSTKDLDENSIAMLNNLK